MGREKKHERLFRMLKREVVRSLGSIDGRYAMIGRDDVFLEKVLPTYLGR